MARHSALEWWFAYILRPSFAGTRLQYDAETDRSSTVFWDDVPVYRS